MNKSKKTGGFLGGFIILIIGIVILWNNEGRVVKTQNAINEATKSYVDVSSKKINSKYEGKLIATTGKINISESTKVEDSKFGISVNATKLQRNVEMFQWVEDCEEDENETKSCTYEKEWSDKLIDSKKFNKSEYNNPSSMKYENNEFITSEDVKVGAYVLPERLLEDLSYNKELNYEALSEQYDNKVEGYVLNEKYITNSKDIENPEIGDIRISYKYAGNGEVSIMGVQRDDTITAFTAKKGKSIFVIKRGGYTGREILISKTDSNNASKWLHRIFGLILVIGGIASLFNPLQSLTSKIPVIGNIVNFSTSLFSGVIGTAISLIVIAIAWFRFRPILSISLLVIVVILVIFLKYKNIKLPTKKEKK